MVSDLVSFGVGVTLAFFGDHMHQHRTAIPMRGLEGPHLSPMSWPSIGPMYVASSSKTTTLGTASRMLPLSDSGQQAHRP